MTNCIRSRYLKKKKEIIAILAQFRTRIGKVDDKLIFLYTSRNSIRTHFCNIVKQKNNCFSGSYKLIKFSEKPQELYLHRQLDTVVNIEC